MMVRKRNMTMKGQTKTELTIKNFIQLDAVEIIRSYVEG